MAKIDKVSLIKDRLDIGKRDTKTKFSIFNELDEIYHGSGKTQPGNAQIHNPYSWANIETIVPRMVARRPTVLYRPREMNDEVRAKNLSALWDYWWDKSDAFPRTVSWLKDSLLYGTGIVKVYWKETTKEVRSYEYGPDGLPVVDPESVDYDELGEPILDNPEKKPKYIEKVETVKDYDDPCIENINIYNFFVDPNATDIQSASWVIHRYYATIEELESYGYYKNLSKLKAAIKTGTDSVEKIPEDQKRHEVAHGSIGEQDDTVGHILCHEMWDKDGLTVLAEANGVEVIIREQENPFWHGKKPFIKLNDSLVPHEFYGKGEVEPVKKLQYALDTVQNQVLDWKNQALMPMWKAKGDIDESELILRPHGVIHVDGELDDVDMIQMPQGVVETGVQEMANLKADIQQALGIYDYTKGAESGANKTATGISLVQEAANARFAHKIQLFEESIKELGEMVMALYQQFITQEKQIRVLGQQQGNETLRLLPQDIAGQYDVDVEAGSSQPINKEAEREDVLGLKQLLSNIPDPNLQYEIDKKVVEKFGMDDLQEPLAQAYQAMAQMQQQQMAMERERMMLEQDAQLQQQAIQQEQLAREAQTAELDMENKRLQNVQTGLGIASQPAA